MPTLITTDNIFSSIRVAEFAKECQWPSTVKTSRKGQELRSVSYGTTREEQKFKKSMLISLVFIKIKAREWLSNDSTSLDYSTHL